ncbi:hypothetical protein JCM3774_002553 [Rhodotorula dairenensis]
MEDTLSRFPSDVLVDSVLAACSPPSLAALGSTCRRWHDFVAGPPCEILWQRRAARDFKFPVHSTGRRTGWYRLYSQLASSSALVWGANQNGRLGIPPERWHTVARIPDPLRRRLIRGGLPVPTRIKLPDPPTTLVAGGWSFHALTMNGQVVSWGEMQPSGPGLSPSRELYKGQTTLAPRVLPQMEQIGSIRQLSAGREHVVLLGEDGKVWEYRAVGRVAHVRDEIDRWGSAGHPDVASVHAGWAYSAILTATNDVYIWWKPDQSAVDHAARSAGEDAAGFDPTTHGVTFPLQVNSLRLPDLPNEAETPDRIRKIACGDEFVVALSDAGKVFYLDISLTPATRNQNGEAAAVAELERDLLTARRQWTYLDRFSSTEALREFGAERPATPSEVRITHVSAQFKTFAAYSVPSTATNEGSIVLLGEKGKTRPDVIPELQNIGVIQVAHGDYHNLALTSSGRILSWGAYSSGALGLGHPDLPNTPLTVPSPPPPPPTTASTATADAATPAPGLVQRAQAFLPPMPATPAYLSSLLPGGLLGGPGPAIVPPRRHLNPPDRVDKPTEIIFDGEELSSVAPVDNGDSSSGTMTTTAAPAPAPMKRKKFVYSITAGGWHSGCLAVDLDSDAALAGSLSTASAGAEEAVDPPVIDFDLARAGDTNAPGRWEGTAPPLVRGAGGTPLPTEENADVRLGGLGAPRATGPFRIGFAGRGANRGAGGSGFTGRGGVTYRTARNDEPAS